MSTPGNFYSKLIVNKINLPNVLCNCLRFVQKSSLEPWRVYNKKYNLGLESQQLNSISSLYFMHSWGVEYKNETSKECIHLSTVVDDVSELWHYDSPGRGKRIIEYRRN